MFRFLRTAVIFVYIVSLSACGGGADQNQIPEALAANSDIQAPVDFYFFDEIAVKASRRFVGNTAEAAINTETMPSLIAMALFGPFTLPVLDSVESDQGYPWLGLDWATLFMLPEFNLTLPRQELPRPGTDSCGNVASNPGSKELLQFAELLASRNELRGYKFDYVDCEINGVTYSGSIELFFVRHTNEMLHEVLIAYDDLHIKFADQHYLLVGTAKSLEPLSCDADGEKLFYLNITDINSAESVFLENYRFGRYGVAGERCAGSASEHNFFSGRILHSELGAFEVSTETPLGDNIRTIRNDLFGDGNWGPGKVQIASAGETLDIGLTGNKFVANNAAPNIAANMVRLVTRSETIYHHRSLFLQGSFLDLHDSDGDGMTNSWEYLAGLDQNNSADALEDNDGDGHSNWLEYQYSGLPNNAAVFGNSVDRKGDLTISHEPKTGTSIWLRYIATNENNSSYNDDSTVTIIADVPGTWDLYDAPCVIGEQNELQCPISSNERIAIFIPDSNGLVQFSSSVPTAVNDLDHTNNQLVSEVNFEKREVDFEVNADSQLEASVGTELELVATIVEKVNANSERLMVSIEAPEGLTLKSVTALFEDDRFPRRCNLSSQDNHAICFIDFLGTDGALNLYLMVESQVAGDYEISWSVRPVDHEVIIDNNVTTTIVTVGNL